MRSAKPRSVVALLVALCAAASLSAQEEPLVAGGEGVPVPKKTKHVQPVYPAGALAQGLRGIVILEIVIDGHGKIASISVLRSVPGLDEAAIGAAQQWEYQPTKVDGKPVSVRLTVPITFSLALPKLQRQAGVPELRQGAAPGYPTGESGGGSASAEITLESDGRIGVATLLAGQPPWSQALLAALKTWRFSPPPDDAILSFRVEAEFVKDGAKPSVLLRATGLQRSELLADSGAESNAEPPASVPQPDPPGSGPATTAAPPAAPVPESAPAAGSEAPGLPAPPTAVAESVAPPATPAAGVTPPTESGAGSADPGSAAATAPPPVEVITAPPPAPPAESGISAIRDVVLEPGVPELARGRRPVAPPFARMSATTGTVEVSFSVAAGGTTTLQTAAGSDLLRYASEQTIASWVFRRTRADRAYLIAVFTYAGDKATALVRPQAAPPPEALAAPTATPPAAPPPPASPPN